MRFLTFLFLSASFAAAGSAQTALKTPPKSDLRLRLDQNAPRWLKQYDVPSVAVAYIENGEPAWTAVYGEQSPGVPATLKTLYNVASLTKPISAEIILRLASAGKISLDEPISAYWVDPEIKHNPWQNLLTPRLCLSHQTGFSNWRFQTNNVLKFLWEPGTRTGYSGEGYDYVARFAEKKTGHTFEDLAEEYVFDPIGMDDTSYTARDWFSGHLAIPQGPKGETEPKTRTTWCAADMLRTTIGDYSKFLVSVMHNDSVTKQIATERLTITRNLVTREQQTKVCAQAKLDLAGCNVIAGMGLGWQINQINHDTLIDHSGADWGVHTHVFFLPQRQIGVVIFTNGDNGENVIRKIVAMIYPNPIYLAHLGP